MKKLILAAASSNMTPKAGFRWPKSGKVVAPSWDPKPESGNGLHGWLEGVGEPEVTEIYPDSKWLVLSVEESTIIDLGGMVKFPEGEVVFCGEQKGAAEYLVQNGCSGAIIGATKIVLGSVDDDDDSDEGGNDCAVGSLGTAIAGNGRRASAGDFGVAIAGSYGRATAKSYGRAAAGYKGKAFAGDHGSAMAGVRGTAIAGEGGEAFASTSGEALVGDWGTAVASQHGTATAGAHGTASVGDYGTAIVGDGGTAIAGEGGTAIAGKHGTATVRDNGRAIVGPDGWARAGVNSIVVISSFVGRTGEGDLEPDVFYKIENGKFVRAE